MKSKHLFATQPALTELVTALKRGGDGRIMLFGPQALLIPVSPSMSTRAKSRLYRFLETNRIYGVTLVNVTPECYMFGIKYRSGKGCLVEVKRPDGTMTTLYEGCVLLFEQLTTGVGVTDFQAPGAVAANYTATGYTAEPTPIEHAEAVKDVEFEGVESSTSPDVTAITE